MQNMYVGDIGDYGKYGLLRAIMPVISKLGIIWYMVPNESHRNDGRHTSYLSSLKFSDCDRELFSALNGIISSGKRHISRIEQAGLFPSHTAFYSEYLTYDGIKFNSPQGRENRLLTRGKWVSAALEAIQGCDAVFLDPDNGLEVSSVERHSSKAPKYVFYSEVEQFLTKTNTLVIYHHLCRTDNHASQIKQRETALKELAGNSYNVVSLRFQPYSPRAYFIITNQQDIRKRIKEFIESAWKQCFEMVG